MAKQREAQASTSLGWSRTSTASLPPPTKRPNAFAESDDEETYPPAGQTPSRQRAQRDDDVELASFGRHGADKKGRSPASEDVRIIPLASNLDWREDRKRRLGTKSKLEDLGPLVSMRSSNDLSATQRSDKDTAASSSMDKINAEGQKRGLEVRKRSRESPSSRDQEAPSISAPSTHPPAPTNEAERLGLDADQEAMQALLAGDAHNNARSDMVISQVTATEEDMLNYDIESRPDAPSLSDYAATPIEEFGKALLRGMGWKEGKGTGKDGKGPTQAPEPKKRAALLGLGAKERPLHGLKAHASSSSRLSSSQSRHNWDKRHDRYLPVATKRHTESGPHHSTKADEDSKQGDSPSSRHESRHRSEKYSRKDTSEREERFHREQRNRRDGRIDRDRSSSPHRDRDTDRKRSKRHHSRRPTDRREYRDRGT